MRSIGLRCKHGDMFSLQVLIGRGLVLSLSPSFLPFHCLILRVLLLSGSYLNILVGANDDEVPPVPIPNTEVKLISVENTWLATAREDRAAPTSRMGADRMISSSFKFYMGH